MPAARRPKRPGAYHRAARGSPVPPAGAKNGATTASLRDPETILFAVLLWAPSATLLGKETRRVRRKSPKSRSGSLTEPRAGCKARQKKLSDNWTRGSSAYAGPSRRPRLKLGAG